MHDFFRELAVKNRQEGDHGAADLCEQMTRTTVKSPGVMEELFRPPTKERLDAWRDRRRSRDLVIDESTDEIEDSSAGIGMLNGKPIFGPVRPADMG